jgi:micrococcal nuclease
MKQKRLLYSFLLLFVILAVYSVADLMSAPESKTYEVSRVVDGDTIIVVFEGKEERLRLIGLDAPESVHSDPERNVLYGTISAEFTKAKLEGQRVTLEFDVQERDQYGRLLAYVYLDGQMFNELLIREGHAKAGTYPPNVKYDEILHEAEEQAREDALGLWEE